MRPSHPPAPFSSRNEPDYERAWQSAEDSILREMCRQDLRGADLSRLPKGLGLDDPLSR